MWYDIQIWNYPPKFILSWYKQLWASCRLSIHWFCLVCVCVHRCISEGSKTRTNFFYVLKDGLPTKWCLPWSVKHKRVKFTFGDNSGWNCIGTTRCNVEIIIIPEKRDSNVCPISSFVKLKEANPDSICNLSFF